MSHARLEVRMESLAPFLQGTCTPYNMPVYPGAQCMIANALIEERWRSPEVPYFGRVAGQTGYLHR
jgi:hypothetical protein